jgi:hypothetical protein
MNISDLKYALTKRFDATPPANEEETELAQSNKALLLAIDALQESSDANSKYSKQYYRNRASMALRGIEEVFSK